MAASAFSIFHTFKALLGQKVLDLESDDIKCALLASTWTPNLATNTKWADISTHQITGDGYTAGGISVTGLSFANVSGTSKWSCDNPSWTAGASGITARYCVFYDNTDTDKTLICYSLLNTAPADYVVTSGNPFTISIPTTGIFQLV